MKVQFMALAVLSGNGRGRSMDEGTREKIGRAVKQAWEKRKGQRA
ncbi:MAG: hypothetical protein WBC04_05005 [Candidatus Acidiferrales bacterium]